MDEAAGTPPPPPPAREGPTLAEMARATAAAFVGAILELVRAVRAEVEDAQRSASAFVGRVLAALARSLGHAQAAARDALLAGAFLVAGVVVLSIFLVGAFNVLLGAPWGGGAAALLLFLLAWALWLRARAGVRAIRREADALAGRRG